MEQNKVKKFIKKNEEVLTGVAVALGVTAVAVGSYMLGYEKCRDDFVKYVRKSSFLSAVYPMIKEADDHMYKGKIVAAISRVEPGINAEQMGELGQCIIKNNTGNCELSNFTHFLAFKKE